MEIYEIVEKLLGKIAPVGESNEDEKRYENLEATIDLIDDLLIEVGNVSTESRRPEHSRNKAGKLALESLRNTRLQIKDYLE
jgi:uncharacterized protein YdcH (DUF465 family)